MSLEVEPQHEQRRSENTVMSEEKKDQAQEALYTAGEKSAEGRNEDRAPSDSEVGEVTLPKEVYQELKSKAEERDRLFQQLQRTVADFENYQKRVKRDRPVWEAAKVRDFVKDLLPVVDDLERLMQAVEGEIDLEEVSKVLKLLRDKLSNVFSHWNIEQVATGDGRFDPQVHEALREEMTEKVPTGTILEVLRPGYVMDGMVIRPAQVVVARNPRGDSGAGDSSDQAEAAPEEASQEEA